MTVLGDDKAVQIELEPVLDTRVIRLDYVALKGLL